MFNEKNLLYYSTNKELERPEPEDEDDFVGELHTATSVIAQVEDEDGAQEIVRRVNMHDELVGALRQTHREAREIIGNSVKFEGFYKRIDLLLKQAEQK